MRNPFFEWLYTRVFRTIIQYERAAGYTWEFTVVTCALSVFGAVVAVHGGPPTARGQQGAGDGLQQQAVCRQPLPPPQRDSRHLCG